MSVSSQKYTCQIGKLQCGKRNEFLDFSKKLENIKNKSNSVFIKKSKISNIAEIFSFLFICHVAAQFTVISQNLTRIKRCM